MGLFRNAAERRFGESLSRLVYVNPFLPERIGFEREALGDAFMEPAAVWSARPGDERSRPNIEVLRGRAEELASALRERLARMERVEVEEAQLYADVVHYVLYYRCWHHFDEVVAEPGRRVRVKAFEEFARDYGSFFGAAAFPRVAAPELDHHIFALYFQIRRAFRYVFQHIVGTSMPVARLRAAVWQSLFTHDLRAYRTELYHRLDDVPTLITGASGTGKELVARAIALARYVPFDAAAMTFGAAGGSLFTPLNLSALSPTLIESELFGHRRGAFTGALENRTGWLEHCPPGGSVFLDEIGELEAQIQVKLLRVLQARTFSRLGETESRPFKGKLIAATNRDLAEEMEQGRFRRDFFYRLRADYIHTPTLAEQLQGAADYAAELRLLVEFVAHRVGGPVMAAGLADRVVAYILENLGKEYAWPGNFRELEQCVRNILIRGEYEPARRQAADKEAWVDAMLSGDLTADEVLDRYAERLYVAMGSFDAAARRLKLDRRTVRARVARVRGLPGRTKGK